VELEFGSPPPNVGQVMLVPWAVPSGSVCVIDRLAEAVTAELACDVTDTVTFRGNVPVVGAI
jgi:hypothetical protein